MKLNREQLLQLKYKVYLQPKDTDGPPRLVKFPEAVDTDASTVEMWTIPVESKENLLAPAKFDTRQPDEITSIAELKTVVGKIVIFNQELVKVFDGLA